MGEDTAFGSAGRARCVDDRGDVGWPEGVDALSRVESATSSPWRASSSKAPSSMTRTSGDPSSRLPAP